MKKFKANDRVVVLSECNSTEKKGTVKIYQLSEGNW